MPGSWDFCPNSMRIKEIPPDDPVYGSFNGWDFTIKPTTPYRAIFEVTVGGLRWYLNPAGTALDITTNPFYNAGRLRDFYKSNRLHGTFNFNHEYLGNIVCRFKSKLEIPLALPDSNGLIGDFTVDLIHHNPGY